MQSGQARDSTPITLSRDILFVGLTRPQMFAGVTYTFFVINFILSTEFFLIFRSVWAVGFALLAHGAGYLACLREPRIFDLWLVKARHTPRVHNYRFWLCNSYRA